MLLHTVKNYQYLADHYSYTESTDADNVTTRTYVDVPTTIRAGINTMMTGDIVILSTEKMQINAYIGRIVDRNNNEIYPNGVWQITQTQPLINSMGYVEGYRYRAKIIQGQV